MKIAVIAHIRHPVAEPFMGGMEAHCRMLCDGLRTAGHTVDLFASGRSDDPQLITICDKPYEDVLPWARHRGTRELAEYQEDAFASAWAYILEGGYDVVHNNSLFPDIMLWAARDDMPCVTSQHVPPFGAMQSAVSSTAHAPTLRSTVTSQDQIGLWDMQSRSNMSVVHNGVRCDRWLPHDEPDEYFIWVGRITPNKGTAHAARAARLAGVSLRIFGPVEDAQYFVSEVEPHLTDGVEYHGHCTADQLRPLVAKAKGALVTPLWDEPFGLVAVEALSCGTPVCAFASGALAEVVGECGFVTKAGDIAALAESMARIGEIDRSACRQRALTKFSVQTMIEGYEASYRAAIDGVLSQAAAAFASRNSRTAALLA